MTLVIKRDHLIVVCLLGLTAGWYYPGLSSPFLLDDFYNLANLAEIEQYGQLYYIFGGFSGPSGRPISLLSFALQHHAWPSSPFAFKMGNLIIHLINGALIYILSLRLASYLEADKRYRRVLALLCCGIWLLHPMHLTTVLYITQRMTQLSCLFTLLGVLGYLHFRERLASKPSTADYCWLTITVYLFAGLAVLSKENGILLLLLIPVVEMTLLSNVDGPRRLQLWSRIFLAGPLFLLIVYLALTFEAVLADYHLHPFTMSQRLMTEPLVLLTYVKNLLVPAYGAFTLFHDDFPAVTGLFDPPHAIIAIVTVSGALLLGLKYRKIAPVLSFSILWFLAGHILEAGHLNLELYYEYRNYLPGFGIFFGISYLLTKFIKASRSYLIPGAVALGYCSLIAVVSMIELQTWSQPAVQAMEWARLHPNSGRSLYRLANIYLKAGEYEKASSVHARMNAIESERIRVAIQKLRLHHCLPAGHNWDADWQKATALAAHAKPRGLKIVASLDHFIVEITQDQCPSVDSEKMRGLLLALIENPDFSYVRGYLYEFMATLHLYGKDYDKALEYIGEALRHRSADSYYLYRIRLLKIMGRDQEAHQGIRVFRERINTNPKKYLIYNKLLATLE